MAAPMGDGVVGASAAPLVTQPELGPPREPLEAPALSLSLQGPREAQAAAAALSLPPEAFGNDPTVELAWAARAFQHAQVHFNLISSVDPKFLKLTKADDRIYAEFRKAFQELRVDLLDQEELKSEPAKEKWRPFCLQFEGEVEDFNYGTLLRLDCSKEYTEENTIFATRIQFFAIEIARNREGCNSVVYNSGRNTSAGTEEVNST